MPLASGRYAIAVCDRCNRKFPWRSLRPDGNSPGLMVCAEDFDQKNPWRYPPISPDPITMRWSRPDTPLIAGDVTYPDITTNVNPQPPQSNFPIFVGLEGTGIEGLEQNGGESGLEP